MPATTPQPELVDSSLASRIPIIEYHDAEYKGGTTVRMTSVWFQEQLKWLYDNGFMTLSGDELLQFALGNARPVKKSCSSASATAASWSAYPSRVVLMAKNSLLILLLSSIEILLRPVGNRA